MPFPQMQWLIDTVFDAVMAALPFPPVYVDRGDPIGWDYAVGDFVWDGNWHGFDLSAIVPAGASAVNIRCALRDNLTTTFFFLRTHGNLNAINAAGLRVQVANIYNDQCVAVALDADRKLDYRAGGGAADFLFAAVCGWWL